jgi:hypothetical protein
VELEQGVEEVLDVVLVCDLEGLTIGVPGQELEGALVEVAADLDHERDGVFGGGAKLPVLSDF